MFLTFADWLVYGLFGLDKAEKSTEVIHFFIYDTVKILCLLFIIIYGIGLIRGGIDMGKIRRFLSTKSKFFGFICAALLGAVTPFCSCSSIPLFLGFTAARIPIGVTMAFLITSPMINEVSIGLLGGILGLKFAIIYVILGLLAGILGGFFFDFIKAERFLQDDFMNIPDNEKLDGEIKKHKLTWKERHNFAKSETLSIVKKVWIWVVIGVAFGAIFHGFVPREFISENLGKGQWWSVLGAVLLGIPLYADAAGIIPIIEVLLEKGLPIGTAIAFMMSTVGASLPAFMILKRVMKPKLLISLFLFFLILFSTAGWIFNAIYIK